MPGGRRRGRRGSGVPTLALRTKSFVQPCLLLLLREGAGHGYELMDRLREAGLADGSLSASAVYRGLREMEERGWVASRWDTTGSGPPRRVYRITREGENVLEEWKREVSEMRTTLDRFLGVYAPGD